MAISKLAKVHTAEHILWEVLKKKYPTMKSVVLQLGPDRSRAEYRIEKGFIDKDTQTVERDINNIIQKNLPVSFETVPRQEAEKVCDLYLVPVNIQQIRLVKIGNVSCEACIGEHVNNTSEIGSFKILETKKVVKNTYRIYFTVIQGIK